MELEEKSCETTAEVVIEFDGGTPCNIPRLGYGIGYGSYKIGVGRQIVRLNFGRPMSANAAEVWTLVHAIEKAKKAYLPKRTILHIHGDSKIALARCHRSKKKHPLKGRDSDEFRQACEKLVTLCEMFHTVETHWRGRARSVMLFGH